MSAVTVYQDRLKAIRTATARQVAAEFTRLDDLNRPSALPFARKVAPIVASGQLLAAKTTNAYIARQAKVPPLRVAPASVTGSAARNGVDLLDEYQRPFGEVWAALGDGLDPDQAKQRGLHKIDVLVLADVWLASRTMTDLIDKANTRITGWVRVADATACDLCSAADGMPMNQAADLAGHPGCGCTSEAVTTDAPTEAADPEAFDVHEHDELGPVLYAAGQSFAH